MTSLLELVGDQPVAQSGILSVSVQGSVGQVERYAAALRSTSFSCSSSRLRLRSSVSSAESSLAVAPAR